jgi:hypothetical protein
MCRFEVGLLSALNLIYRGSLTLGRLLADQTLEPTQSESPMGLIGAPVDSGLGA